jgi:hypothetical protein
MSDADAVVGGSPALEGTRVPVVFIRPHTHAGVKFLPGQSTTVDSGDAALMRSFGAIASDDEELIAAQPGEPDPDARAALWHNSDGRLWGVRFVCPGCKADDKMTHHSVCTEAGFTGTPRWEFNNDLNRPTLAPSIRARYGWAAGEVVCHSFVRAGRIEYQADCTHSMAGKTVDLPPYSDDE